MNDRKMIAIHFPNKDVVWREDKCPCCDDPIIPKHRDTRIVETISDVLKALPSGYTEEDNYVCDVILDYSDGENVDLRRIDRPIGIGYFEDLGKMPIKCKGYMSTNDLQKMLDWSPNDAIIFVVDGDNVVPVSIVRRIDIDIDTDTFSLYLE